MENKLEDKNNIDNRTDNNASFSYTYSAKQQDEVKRILRRYAPQEQSKLEQLRKLDESAEAPGRIASIITGVISTLVLGVGMCCTMVWTGYFALGVVVGIIGIAGVCAAYPLYSAVTKRQRAKLAPEVLRLSAELMGQR